MRTLNEELVEFVVTISQNRQEWSLCKCSNLPTDTAVGLATWRLGL